MEQALKRYQREAVGASAGHYHARLKQVRSWSQTVKLSRRPARADQLEAC